MRSSVKKIFSNEDQSCLPLTFFYGEISSQDQVNIDAGTRFSGEETISHPSGGAGMDTD